MVLLGHSELSIADIVLPMLLWLQLRHHPLPRQEHFDSLVACALSKGFTIDTQTNKALADSLDRCVDPADPEVNKVRNNDVFNTLTPEQDGWHFADDIFSSIFLE